jgi:hypothetical protein
VTAWVLASAGSLAFGIAFCAGTAWLFRVADERERARQPHDEEA